MNPLLGALRAREAEFVALRRDIHRHPEMGFEEQRTAALVADRLEAWGYGVERGIAGTGLELIEVAPGIDVERDVLAHMGFRPAVAKDLRTMDARIFLPGKMGLAPEIMRKPRGYRSERVARWHAARAAEGASP